MIQRPTAVGLILCEQVIVEENTHNITLVNCMMRLGVHETPSEPHRVTFNAWLTDGIGAGRIKLFVSRLDTLEEIWVKEAQAVFPDPLRTLRVTVRDSLSFPVEGRYLIGLLVDGEMIAHRALQVFVREETS